MPQAHLVACPACTRHVRVSESACPFCGNAFDATLRAIPRSRTPDLRLGRVALYALGAGTMTLAAACSSSSPTTTAFYGVPPDAAFGEPPDAGADAPGSLTGTDASSNADDAGDSGDQ
jgi:hypothetical protein